MKLEPSFGVISHWLARHTRASQMSLSVSRQSLSPRTQCLSGVSLCPSSTNVSPILPLPFFHPHPCYLCFSLNLSLCSHHYPECFSQSLTLLSYTTTPECLSPSLTPLSPSLHDHPGVFVRESLFDDGQVLQIIPDDVQQVTDAILLSA